MDRGLQMSAYAEEAVIAVEPANFRNPPEADHPASCVAEKSHITPQLRTVECGAAISEGILEVAPDQPSYGETLAWVGEIRPGETKSLFARNPPSCEAG